MDIILASKSPRRGELLSMLGYEFTVRTADAPEPPPSSSLPPAENLRVIADAKGRATAYENPDAAVIAADTVVVLDNVYFGKPADERGAAQMLKRLSGRTHDVYTGVIVHHIKSGFSQFDCARTKVTFRRLSENDILDYIATGEPTDKAGAYGIQGFGAKLIERVDGDFFNVMGLPVGLLRAILFNLLGK